MAGCCLIEDCTRRVYARGWCNAHYVRWRKYGDVTVNRNTERLGESVRFWAFVDKTEACWLWTGGTSGSGYGKFWRDDGSTATAHRFAYENVVGPIPEGVQLDHLKDRCSNRRCVKVVPDEHGPEHLEPVTPRENTMRSDGLTAQNAKKTHCPKGHPYDLENTYLMPPSKWAPNGGRVCRECRYAAYRRWAAKRKEQS